MRVGVNFTIYDDFTKYTRKSSRNHEFSYERAVAELNKRLKKYVKKGDLAFTYDLEPVEIELPITKHQCGNIFGPEDYDGSCWDDVTIYCEIPVDKFDTNKLDVDAPGYFSVRCVYT